MKQIIYSVLMGVCALGLTTGCASLMGERQAKTTIDAANQPVYSEYTVHDQLRVRVKFENQESYDAVQFGLHLIAEQEGSDKPVSIESPEFYPRYFAMVNVNIEDGLLYISQDEASNFARMSYTTYQAETVPEELLRKLKAPRTVGNVSINNQNN